MVRQKYLERGFELTVLKRNVKNNAALEKNCRICYTSFLGQLVCLGLFKLAYGNSSAPSPQPATACNMAMS